MTSTHASYERYAKITIVIFLIVKLAWFSPHMLVLWDEAVYIGMGKYLYSGQDVGLWEPFRPILIPVLVGIPWLLGIPIIGAKAVSLGFALATLIATYLLACRLYDARVGFYATAILAFSFVFLFESTQVMTDLPAGLFGLLALFALIAKRPLLAGILVGLAFLVKFPAGLYLPALLIIAYLKTRSLGPLISLGGGFALAAMPVLIISAIMTGSPVQILLDALAHQDNLYFATHGLFANLLYYPIALLASHPLLLLAFFAIEKRSYPLLIPAALILAYLTAIVNKQERFVLLALPLIAILAGTTIARIATTPPLKKAAIGTLIVIGATTTFFTLSFVEHAETPHQEFFRSIDLPEHVGISDPVIAAYRDAQFIPLYFSYDTAIEILRETKPEAVIFSREAYGCVVFGEECWAYIDEIEEFLEEHYTPIASVTHEGIGYTLYS